MDASKHAEQATERMLLYAVIAHSNIITLVNVGNDRTDSSSLLQHVFRRTLSFHVSAFKCFHMQTLMPH